MALLVYVHIGFSHHDVPPTARWKTTPLANSASVSAAPPGAGVRIAYAPVKECTSTNSVGVTLSGWLEQNVSESPSRSCNGNMRYIYVVFVVTYK